MKWTVTIRTRALKQVRDLPEPVRQALVALVREIEEAGPVRGNWPNYSALPHARHHCHLKKGKPTYVAVWAVRDREIRLVEVTYAGTHGKAPY
ncbi:MAG: cytotoxic translational repressor of toxin-antitoxin stability system [Lentisphaerae bacterium RIFOXYB12_FULL_65_16]|nr:MAG: cytotoxic translational repressor of toxin-antitoxin stability system [Lentisphaerae bacterium RIFOXYA12_64_32]OGV92210.1 MAG: cytotoxic translational repressor of toxin-antitoxin stability system [Lentisphaerae bacterium RIFOXYB12_FULL_65_16]